MSGLKFICVPVWRAAVIVAVASTPLVIACVAAAEDLTDEILTRAYSAVLNAIEVAELAGLVAAMRAHFDAYAAADG